MPRDIGLTTHWEEETDCADARTSRWQGEKLNTLFRVYKGLESRV